jgi:hypothetical protein
MGSRFNSELSAPAGISVRHSVSFYHRTNFPEQSVSEYFRDWLNLGEPALVIATREHAEAISDRLSVDRLPVSRLKKSGMLTYVDAEAALNRVRREGLAHAPIPPLLAQFIESAQMKSATRRVRIVGELVSLLVADGRVETAIELERIWNRLLSAYPIDLYCLYEDSAFESTAALGRFCAICEEHDAVLTNRAESFDEPGRTTWFVILQKQASLLRQEVLQRKRAERVADLNQIDRLDQLETSLRIYGLDPAFADFQEIVNLVVKLCDQAERDRAASFQNSPEWFKRTGEILGYAKVIAYLTRLHGA